MTIASARDMFEELKEQILKDGKVDLVETYALLDFIEDYAKAGKPEFVEFKRLLLAAAKDKVITDEESKKIIEGINNVSEFLKMEQGVEAVFFGVLGIFILSIVLHIIFG